MLVIDTNIWISFAINRKSVLGQSVARIIKTHPFAFSEATFRELTEVILRNQFDPYVPRSSRIEMLRLIGAGAEWFILGQSINTCRDSKDNSFLELAVAANATHILSGDKDLLDLDPFRGIRIIRISEF